MDFANFGSLVVTADPPTTIDEGSSVTIHGSFSNVPQAHTITILWGDGDSTVINNTSGDFDFECRSYVCRQHGRHAVQHA